jgi:uncharacterized 2Fe-2S/4Fe-4S cluster protein (DUF4445 family)
VPYFVDNSVDKPVDKYYKVTFLPSGREVNVREGATLYDAALSLGIPLKAECGAQGSCGQCIVKVEAGAAAPTPHARITPSQEGKGYRLACQVPVTGNLVVFVPDESMLPAADIDFEAVILSEDETKRERVLSGLVPFPPVRQVVIEMPAPTLEDSSADRERLLRALRAAGVEEEPRLSLPLLRKLPHVLRDAAWRPAVVLFQDGPRSEIVAAYADRSHPLYGLALDLGTTTIVGELVDLRSGACRHRVAAYNRQLSCGADIISRIVYAGKPGGARQLRNLALETIGVIMGVLSRQTGVSPDNVVLAAVAGNTTMTHLLLGIPAEHIRLEPYTPVMNRCSILGADEIGLPINPSAPVYVAPGIGSYVGGDVLAGVLVSGMHRSEELTLFIDAGTNGEIVLGNRDWMMGCACSTGPAFEGIGITCGMMAAAGAIETVAIETAGSVPRVETIAGAPARGVCGSGMIDMMAELFLRGIIDRRGELNRDSGCPRIEQREGHPAYMVRKSGEQGAAREIHLGNVDLKKLLRTKAAIQAAIITMLKCTDLEERSIGRVVIAGRLGEAIRTSSAVAIGMLPRLPVERFEYLGNGSLWGANLMLLSGEKREEITALADRITYLDLSTHPHYMDEFIASLFIPHTNAPRM